MIVTVAEAVTVAVTVTVVVAEAVAVAVNPVTVTNSVTVTDLCRIQKHDFFLDVVGLRRRGQERRQRAVVCNFGS